ncbi:hybrid sensor histidine kinase/response regulator [Limobrevibacterium gyesilva]|uniref:histidine kinase n=1 Tax=Limobrevibacterium gyesilva TaxID=2991712 RepID=A0AA42CIB2_9PROT|nr:ATP-binding protein [Limobrevibacterium gyesilva]MCW3475757.1 ATP-binding protein [Limobrevibacterium gyesilva]
MGTVVARTNLLTRLLILIVVATIPPMLVMAYMQQSLRNEGRQRIAEEALRQAELLDADMSNVVEGARQLSLAITHFATVRNGDPACRRSLEGLRADLPSYEVLSVIADDGQIICTTDSGAGPFAGAAAIAHVRDVIGHGKFETGTYTPATPTRRALLPFCMPFTLKSGRHAVVVVGLSLDWLGAHLGDLKRPPESTIGIADRDGTTIARFPDHDKFVGKPFPPPVRPLFSAPRRGNAVVMGYDGKERLVGFVPASDGPVHMFVSIGMYLPGILAELDRETMRGTVLIAVGGLISLLLALVFGQRFVRRPTATLLAAARRWSSGDLSARARLDEPPGSEFGSLALAFNDMAAALGQQRAELQNLNATLEARVEERTRDLSESRNRLQVEMAERENTEATLRQAQKLQAVGQLAGGIAHDFNNLLTAIVGALDLLRGRLPAGQESLVRLVDNALLSAERGGKLTGQLLAFSRRQRLLPVPSDLNMTVVALSNLLGSTLGRSIRIQTDLVQDLWPAMVDPSQIEAVIINLAINARDAMPDGGVLTIATRNVTLGVGGNVAPGDYVAVRVSDTGTGMAPEVMARVFEPFFTTKEPGRGSGLGLSQVHGLAMQSGGDVRIESKPGEGTTVTLLLPRAKAMPAMPRPDPLSGRAGPRRRARILVVDDDSDVRQMTGEMLSERGYAVELASGGEEALAILARDGGFDALLVDYVMPGMNGVALIQAAHAIRPGLRTLMITGHAELQAGEAIGAESILRKPYNIAILDERLERLLARPLLRAVPGGLSGTA